MTADEQLRLPYPGLRSFRREETDLFFGRESSVDEMVDRLAQSRFLAVLGASGSGKSSLVRTGLLDALELGLLAEAGSHWRVIDIHPGGEPLRNLARGLLGRDAGPSEVDHMRAFLQRGPRSVIEWCRDGQLQPDENLLLLVDQFEELFRYQHYEERQEAEAFVGLLLESARNRGVPIYIVITMRSEFLSACALIDGLAEAMNRGQYLTPRMSRDQCRTAIEGPAAVCGFKIEPDLVNRILNDLSDFAPWDESAAADQSSQLDRMVRRADQLPLLEHALNRLWVRAVKAGGDVVLRLADYLALGGLKGTLHGHLTHILDELGPEKRKTAEAIFRALTIGTSIADAVRRPTRISELVAISGAKLDEVVEVCEAFRAPGRSFLTPPADTPLTPETVVDISHESLIRQWRDLSAWLEKEAQGAEALRRLDTAAQRAKAQKGDFLTGRDLANLAAWVHETKPTEPWAKRYVKDPGAAFKFLDESIANEKGRSSWELRKKVALISFAIVVPILVTGLLWVWNTSVELATANAELEGARKELSDKVDQLSRLNTDLEATRKDLDDKNKALGAAQEQLASNLNETVDTVMEFIGEKVDELQRAGDFEKSGNLLAAFIEKTRRDGGDVSPRVLKRFAPRFALQVAANGSGMVAVAKADMRGNRMMPVPDEGQTTPPPAFALWATPAPGRRISVVDGRTGRTTAVFDFDEATLGELAEAGTYLLSPDGRHAVLVGKDGRLFRWSMGEASARRILDRRWLAKSSTVDGEKKVTERKLKSAAFDATSGSIALIYNEFETDFLTIAGAEKAWSSPSWPIHRISTALNTAANENQIIPAGIAIVDDDPAPAVVVGITGSDVVLELNVWQQGDWVRGLAVYNSETRRTRWLISPSRFLDSQPTTDPRRIHVLLRTGQGKCEGFLTPTEISNDTRSICAADFSLKSKQLVTTPRLIPFDAQLEIAAEPIDPNGSEIRLQASPRPAWRLSNASGKTPQDGVADILWWAQMPDQMRAISHSEGNIVGMTTLNDVSEMLVLDAKEAEIGNGESGRVLVGRKYPVPDELAIPDTSAIDGAGRTALASSSGKLLAWFTDRRPARWLELTPVDKSNSCKSRSQQTNAGNSASPTGPSRLRTLASMSSSRPWFFATRDDGGIAVISIASPSVAQVKCLDLKVEEVLHTDYERSVLLLRVRDRGVSSITRLEVRDEKGHIEAEMTGALDPGVSANVKQAALLRDGRIATIDASGDMNLFDPVRNAGAPIAQVSAVLPPADQRYQISTRDGMVLLLREDGASSYETGPHWVSAMVVDAAADEPHVVFAGMLPISLGEMKFVRLADQDGLVELLTMESLFRIRLQPTQTAENLALAVEAIGNATIIDRSERGFVNLGAQALALTEKSTVDNQASTPGYLECMLTLERAIRAWKGSREITQEADDVRTACGKGSQLPSTASAVLALLENPADVAGEPVTWPQGASTVLSAAAAGDITALRVLLSWGAQMDSKSLLSKASNALLGKLLESSAGEGRRAESEAGFATYLDNVSEGADPLAHRAIAAMAEDSGDTASPERIVRSFRHYWLAEALFRKAGATDEMDIVARRRVVAARSLPLADLPAVAKDLTAWTPSAQLPEVSVPPAETGERLRKDLATIDMLAQRLGPDRSWDLLKLHVLSILAERAEKAAAVTATAREEIAGLLLAHDDWPSSSGSESSELLSLMDRAVDYLPAGDARRTMLRLRTSGYLERSDPRLDFANADNSTSPAGIYQRALDDILDDLSRDPGRKTQVSYAAGKRAFSYSNVSVGNGGTFLAVQKALDARVRLIDALADRRDLATVRHATRFWQAVSIVDANDRADAFFPPAEKEVRRKRYLEYLGEAFAGFKAALRDGLADNDDMAVALASANWTASESATFKLVDVRDALAGALPRFEHLGNLVERGVWSPVYEDILSHQRSLFTQLAHSIEGEPNEDTLDTLDAYRRRLQDLEYVALAGQTDLMGNTTIQRDAALNRIELTQLGYTIAYVAGRHAWQSRPSERNACDVEAASPYDPKRRAPGKQFGRMNIISALAACKAELKNNREDATNIFQHARALGDSQASPAVLEEKLVDYERAARSGSGYAIAFNNLGFEADKIDEDLAGVLFAGYIDRVVRDDFANAYQALMPVAQTASEKAALHWFAERSAAFGSSAANEALASLASDPSERKFRLHLALRNLPTSDANYARLLAEAEAILLGEQDESWVNRRLETWQAAEIPTLPNNVVKIILTARTGTR